MVVRRIPARSLQWVQSIGGGKFAYVGSCKVSALVSGIHVVERVDENLMPTSFVDSEVSLDRALALVAAEPAPVCLGCGQVVAGPQFVIPDGSCP